MKEPKNIECLVNKDKAGMRLDIFLFQANSGYSRSFFSKLIKEGSVQINSKTAKPSYKVCFSDRINFQFPDKNHGIPAGEVMPLDIIYENSDAIVVNKPAGMIVHPTAGNEKGALVNALLNYYPKIREATLDKTNPVSLLRPGVVHRLDKDTSGLIIVAKNKKAMEFLSKEIKGRKAKKIYWALCIGWPEKEDGELINYIGRHKTNRKQMAEVGESNGRKAISKYRVIKYFKNKTGERYSLIEFDIKTGRTHQIRLQSKMMGHPVAGDPVYNTKESTRRSKALSITRQLLHAKRLSIRLPKSNNVKTFSADIPDDFKIILNELIEIR